MISAYEIETGVLSEIGAGPGLSTQEQEASCESQCGPSFMMRRLER
jgi:hypothetical protein